MDGVVFGLKKKTCSLKVISWWLPAHQCVLPSMTLLQYIPVHSPVTSVVFSGLSGCFGGFVDSAPGGWAKTGLFQYCEFNDHHTGLSELVNQSEHQIKRPPVKFRQARYRPLHIFAVGKMSCRSIRLRVRTRILKTLRSSVIYRRKVMLARKNKGFWRILLLNQVCAFWLCTWRLRFRFRSCRIFGPLGMQVCVLCATWSKTW